MTIYNWAELRDHAIDVFAGDLPGAALEETILHHFEREPARVATAIDQIGKQVAAGKIRSGWAILIRELGTQTKDVQASDNAERSKQLALAEQWIANAGGYIDRESELVSELYDEDLGRLRHWPDTQQRIVACWRENRYRFERTEREAIVRQRRNAKTRTRLAAALAGTGSPIDTDLHAGRIAQEVDRARYGIDPHRDDYIDQLAEVQAEQEEAA